MKKVCIGIFLLVLIILIILAGCAKKVNLIEDNKYKIVTSFYPMYIIAINLTDGIDNVSVSNMTDNNAGCLHNYTLQTEDLKQLSKANMFIMNGLEVEKFVDKIRTEYSNLEIIDTSTVEMKLIQDSHGINGHVWNGINNYIEQVEAVLNGLCAGNPENTEQYTSNAEKYMSKLNKLKQEQYIAKEGSAVISCNEALAYMLNDAKLDVIEVYSDHENSALSTEKLSNVIQEAKNKNIKTIFIAKGDNRKTAETIADEINATIYELDANLTGEQNKDAYINSMKNNYKILKECLE